MLDKFPSTTFLIAPFRRLFPQASIVMLLRDPRDVVVSCFLRQLALNPVSAMFSRLDWTVGRCCAEWQAWLLIREKLPQPWVEVRYEDIVQNNYEGLQAAHRSMGMVWDDHFADYHASLQREPARSPTYAQLRERVSSARVGRWRHYEEFLAPQRKVLDEFAARLGYDV